jgi:hypothetical protein
MPQMSEYILPGQSTKMLIKLIQFVITGAILYKKHSTSPIEWPQYDGETSVLEGSQAKKFLKQIGLPKEILKK